MTDGLNRLLRVAPSALVETYNAADAPITGEVVKNGQTIENTATILAREGRRIEITTSENPETVGEVDPNELVGDQSSSVADLYPQGETDEKFAEQEFDLVFGECVMNDDSLDERCQVHNAVKAFLSHWLVGGEMPPKIEK